MSTRSRAFSVANLMFWRRDLAGILAANFPTSLEDFLKNATRPVQLLKLF